MTLQYNLPAFGPRNSEDPDASGSSFPDPKAAGVWRKAQGSLSDLSFSMQAATGGSVDGVKSIPDPWAQPRTFADAITRKGHPLGETSIKQWRGLLALFALEDAYKDTYDLKLTPVDLEQGRSRLGQILRALPPKTGLPQGGARGAVAQWTQPVLLQIQLVEDSFGPGQKSFAEPVSVGLMNPACLVSPSRTHGRLAVAAVEWMREGLTDPTLLEGKDRLSDTKLCMIRAYVEQLAQDVDELAGGTQSALLRELQTQLKAYRDALKALAPRSSFEIKVGAPQGAGALPDLYARLVRQVTAVVARPDEASECRIDVRSDPALADPARLAKNTFKGVILVDPSMSQGRLPNNVLVWGEASLSDLEDKNRFRVAQSEAAREGYLMVRREHLFAPTMAQLGRQATIPGNPEPFKNSLIPLSPLALLLMSPEALSNALTLRWDGSDRCVVGLKLPVRRAAAEGQETWTATPQTVLVEHVYAANPADGEGRLRQEVNWTFGDVAVWPDFVSRDWHNYFARITYSKKQERARGRFALSAAALGEHLAPTSLGDRASKFLNWLAPIQFGQESVEAYAGREFGEPWLNRMRSVDGDVVAEELQTSPHAFEAIFFTAGEAAGLALLGLQHVISGGESGEVGIDFGTTNTVACMDDSGPVVFEDRVVHPIRSTDHTMLERASDAMRWPFADFMPPARRRTPTPTVVLDKVVDRVEDLRKVATLQDDRILFSHVIYFQPETATLASRAEMEINEMRDVLGRARFNLKWDDDDLVRQAAHRFLRQLMLMVSAEALVMGKNLPALTWRFSRPDAQEESHAEFLEIVRRRLTQIIPDADARARVPRLYSEAVAAGNFMLQGGDSGFKRGSLNVVLDIGGGTTDVTFWAGDDPLWKGSYKLAGGDFFTSYIVNNPAFLDLFGLEGWAAILGSKEGGRRSIAPKRLFVGELLFSGSTLAEAMDELWAEKSGREEARALVRTAYVFLGGIAFHLGSVARDLIRKGQMPEEAMRNVAFALCGRGSGLFAKLHHGAPQDDTGVSRVLSLFAAGAGLEERRALSVFRSEQPKLEVARGMVMPDPDEKLDIRQNKLKDILTDQPLGIGLTIGGTPLPADHSAEAGPPAGKVGDPDLAEFRRFLNALAEQTRFSLDVTAGGAQSTEVGIRNALEEAVAKAQKPTAHGPGKFQEPPFITALRALLGEMTASGGSSGLKVVDTRRAAG